MGLSMIIHVVQQGETIQSIADLYNITPAQLVLDNGLSELTALVTGQSLVIAYPELTYTVKEGDTLSEIADLYQVSIMQLLRNNPYLSDREYIYPGDIIIISYNTSEKISTHGNATPFINSGTLRKTLPYLTYLSVLNYTATKDGDIISYYDDTEIILTSKEYGVMPLMLLTTLTLQGEANIGITFDTSINEDFQQKQIDNILSIIRTKGYAGVNISFEYINISNLTLYESYFTKISRELKAEGFLIFVTINTHITNVDSEVMFEKIDYSILNQLADNIIFMNYQWATNINPPSPISSIYNIDVFLNYVSNFISPVKEIIGLVTNGYDWELPFSAGLTSVYSLSYEGALELANIASATIQFDDISQTPFFLYNLSGIAHIVWFIDARSINALLGIINQYNLNGIGIWNINIYNPQLWLIINSQYEIEKLLNCKSRCNPPGS
jgi:spore germination protein